MTQRHQQHPATGWLLIVFFVCGVAFLGVKLGVIPWPQPHRPPPALQPAGPATALPPAPTPAPAPAPSPEEFRLALTREVTQETQRVQAPAVLPRSLASLAAVRADVMTFSYYASVKAIVDGDTFEAVLTKPVIDAQQHFATPTQVVLRLSVDCPELDQPFGPEAKRALINEIAGKTLVAEFADVTTVDTDAKLQLCRVWDEARSNEVSLSLVSKGLAWVYFADEAYQAAQKAAQDAKTGLWSSPDAVAPWKWRVTKTMGLDLPETPAAAEDAAGEAALAGENGGTNAPPRTAAVRTIRLANVPAGKLVPSETFDIDFSRDRALHLLSSDQFHPIDKNAAGDLFTDVVFIRRTFGAEEIEVGVIEKMKMKWVRWLADQVRNSYIPIYATKSDAKYNLQLPGGQTISVPAVKAIGNYRIIRADRTIEFAWGD